MEQSYLFNIYDRLASLGRAMQKSSIAAKDSQTQQGVNMSIETKQLGKTRVDKQVE